MNAVEMSLINKKKSSEFLEIEEHKKESKYFRKENEKLQQEISELKTFLTLQREENKKLIKLLEKYQLKIETISKKLFEKEPNFPSRLNPKKFGDYFENDCNSNQFKNPIPNISNECFEFWEKKDSMITSTFSSGLKVVNQIIELGDNDNFNPEGMKQIKQEILNDSQETINIEYIEFKSSGLFLEFFFFILLLRCGSD